MDGYLTLNHYDSLFKMFERLLELQRRSSDEQIDQSKEENIERKALYSYFKVIIEGIDEE